MEILQSFLAADLSRALIAIPAFLFVLTVVVFFHELGHFLPARFFGVRVETFSIGFGGEIFGFNDSHGTRWKVCWIPLGGYVKFFGDENAASMPSREKLEKIREEGEDLEHNIYFKPLYQRAIIVAMGPIANFILAIVVFAALFMAYGERNVLPRVGEVVAESAAASAGFEPGDLILEIDGREISDIREVQRIVALSADTELNVVVERAGSRVTLNAVPQRTEVKDRFGNVNRIGRIGIVFMPEEDDVSYIRHGPASAVVKGTDQTFEIVSVTMTYLGRLVMGRESADQLSGPIGIARMSGEVATLGLPVLISFLATISVSIGLINLFPIPPLDGGHLVYYAFEGVTGNPLSERAQDLGFRIGLALVLALLIIATWNDLT